MSHRVASMRCSEVPAYLRGSSFYNSLDDENADDVIDIPAECFKIDDSVYNIVDFGQLLRVMIFWGVDTIPVGLLIFCLRTEISVWDNVAEEILGDSSNVLTDLKAVFRDSTESPLYHAIETNRTDVVSYLATVGDKEQSHCSEMNRAAKLGRLDYVQLLYSSGFCWTEVTCAEAAAGGQIDCLRYLHENGCPWDENVFVQGIQNGEFSCVCYAHVNRCSWSEAVTTAAAECGNCLYLRYLLENGCPFSENACMTACAGDHLDCLVCLHEHGAVWGAVSTQAAARRGSIRCLEYLLEHNFPQDDEIALSAVEGGSVECLRLLHEHGCPWDERITNAAVRAGNLPILRYAFEHDCPYQEDLLKTAAEMGNLPCLQFLLEDRILSMDGEASIMAAALVRADFRCVQYLVDMGCPFTSFARVQENVPQALEEDYELRFMECLEYIVDHGWRCNSDLMRFVAQHNLRRCEEYIKNNS